MDNKLIEGPDPARSHEAHGQVLAIRKKMHNNPTIAIRSQENMAAQARRVDTEDEAASRQVTRMIRTSICTQKCHCDVLEPSDENANRRG